MTVIPDDTSVIDPKLVIVEFMSVSRNPRIP